ncbi:DsbA family protein [Microbacterium sp. ASV49]|uniref:DsbA family protein n=1 Tax=Microbacterium candidum TaxID=3041922 RepID=UPI00257226FF|nr:thioredoxin domain-containing protein [Microbacterium sp. ASV49]
MVVLIGVTALVVLMNSTANSPGATPAGAHITSAGAITFGDSTQNSVTTYVDFLCPYCNQFEQSVGPTIKQKIDEGKTSLEVFPMGVLDTRSNPAGYSSRAASAMYSIAIHDYAHAYDFLQAMYANQPEEGSAGLSDQQIIDVAKNAGVNMTSDLEKEIKTHTYQKFAQSTQLPQGTTGTPTVLVNDKLIAVTMDPQTDIIGRLK